jgi:hypothetical protein
MSLTSQSFDRTSNKRQQEPHVEIFGISTCVGLCEENVDHLDSAGNQSCAASSVQRCMTDLVQTVGLCIAEIHNVARDLVPCLK